MIGSKTYHSPFKINLGLEILSKRPDGYHEINTVFYRFNEPHDSLTVTDGETFRFTSNDQDLPTDDRNLVVRAIALCAEYQNNEMPPISIRLEKVIPSGAGLGGGSGNAATAIKLYSELVQSLSPAEQLEIGAKLGADVPFFLIDARAAIASGIGNILRPLNFTLPYSCLIVKPKQLFTSTTESYAGLKISGKRSATDLSAMLQEAEPGSWQETIVNDFEPLVFQRYPELNDIRGQFLQYNAFFTLMSGSGGASYALFSNKAQAEKACDAFKEKYPDGFVALAA